MTALTLAAAGTMAVASSLQVTYHIAEDPAENHNLAGRHRDKLIELIAM